MERLSNYRKKIKWGDEKTIRCDTRKVEEVQKMKRWDWGGDGERQKGGRNINYEAAGIACMTECEGHES